MDCTQIFFSAADVTVTFFVGVAAAYYAHRQNKTAKDSVRIEMYSKRYEIYRSVKKLLSSVMRDGEATDEAMAEYYVGISDAEFLFDEDVIQYLEKIREATVAQFIKTLQYRTIAQGELRQKYLDEAAQAQKYLMDQVDEVKEHFRKYLNVSDLI